MKTSKKLESVSLLHESSAQDQDYGRVRERAYELWLAEGQPQGREIEHWLQAEREIVWTENQPTPSKRRRTSSK